jgi:hypothetical protein
MAQTAHSTATDPVRARKVMDRNFFGIEEAILHFRVEPSQIQLALLANIPFGEWVLEACKKTHVLVAVFPMSILALRGTLRDHHPLDGQDWYDAQRFATEKGGIGWMLIRKTPLDGSMSKTLQEQILLLSKDEVVPSARIVAYAAIGHLKATGERLFENASVRCADLISKGSRVFDGAFASEGLFIDHYWDDRPYSRLGVAFGSRVARTFGVDSLSLLDP